MRQIRIGKRHPMVTSRKVPLNTIILPPISPTFPQDIIGENGAQLIGKVTVNKSNNGDLMLPRTPEMAHRSGEAPQKSPSDNARIAQLEQNIKFLQEQHQLMLNGLHGEVESLKNRNRELQFQLVFAKGSLPSSPSSPEDDSKYKVFLSPKPCNTTPLQVEILEKELGEIKLQVQELESRNIYLSAIVDEQKKKLERYERDREKEREQRATSQITDEQIELHRKLEDAEAVIRRLRRENSDLRRDNSSQHYHRGENGGGHHRENGGGHHHQQREQNGYQSPRGGNNHQGRGNNRGHRSGNGGNNGHYNNGRNWFPPLHSQSYWQGGRQNDRSNNGDTSDNATGTALPNLQQSSHENTHNGQHQQYNNGKKGSNNNHYHNNGEGRKYRGGNKSGKPA